MRVVMHYRGFLIGETARDFVIVNKLHDAPTDAHGHIGKGRDSIGTCKRVVDLIHNEMLAHDDYLRGCQARLVGHETLSTFRRPQAKKYYNRPRTLRGGRKR